MGRVNGRNRALGYVSDSLRELWVRPEHQVPALDAVRAAAVIIVIIGHFYNTMWRQSVPLPIPAMSNSLLFYYGWAGVDLFFVLSGYLIGMQLWKERQKTGTVRVGQFILKRGFRIWPLYYAVILLGVIAGVGKPGRSDLVFLSNYLPSSFNRGWSLSTEEQFYILVPVLLALSPWVRRLESYYALLVAATVSVWVSRWWTCKAILAAGAPTCRGLDAMFLPFHLHCEGLLAGLAIALLAVARPHLFVRKPGDGFSWKGFAVLVTASVIGAVLYAIDRQVFSLTSLGLIFGGLTLWLLWDRSVFSRPASWRVWYPFSRLSYGMYLNHFFLLSGVTGWVVMRLVAATGSTTIASYLGIVTGIAVSMSLAVLTFVFVERPFLLLRGRWLAAKKRSASYGTHEREPRGAMGGTLPQPETALPASAPDA